MSTLRKLKRNLNERNVWIAKKVEQEKTEIAKKLIEERVEKDADFARDVLKALGENIPEKLKKSAEETIAKETEKAIEEKSV